ncbi:cdc25-like protein phosphatase twine isoform X2 [Solenopsis invicta]|uniref:cdc25-like protein phosphatase twine isoform X2 n=1 Tax=Solenopsis invicta TaxID=13686 RepID=UPI000595FFE8|nr:cdc25-like protein phosphatase twine isoform X2 [Solenopsis invicta]
MDGESSTEGALGEAPIFESPMSNIASDLSKSSLDSGSAKKRHFPRSKGTSSAFHCVNDQRSDGDKRESWQDTWTREKKVEDTERNYYVKTLTTREWQNSSHGKNDYNKENNGTSSNLPYSCTPQRRCKKVRQPLEDYDENSQDSGHPSSPMSEKLRKRRELYRNLNIPEFKMKYPMCSYTSPPHFRGLKTTSSTLLRSLSSGYESMDDGLMSELNDMETTDEEEMQLPSGISKLLSGDIVAPETSADYDVSTTPDFSRNLSPKVKTWMSVQNGMYKRNIQAMSPPAPLARSPSLARRSPSVGRTSSSPRWTPLEKKPLEKMTLSKIRTCLFRSPTAYSSKRMITRTFSYDEASAPYYRLQMEISPQSARSYKRPSEDLLEDEASILKRSRKSQGLRPDATPVSARRSSTLTRPQIALQRSLSETVETHTNIKWAIHRSTTDSDLIGDFSKPCILPLTSGIHSDLKTITSDTMAALLRGEFADRVNSYSIVDCRYPYEYEAGHIEGAVNIYNIELIQQIMFKHLANITPKIHVDTDKRNILVFHCEFSWERAPNLSRILRRLDRECNKEHYPALHYPEMYLLLGGYEKFYGEQKEFCSPQDYKPMKHPNHEAECRFFRSKCKSWQAEKTKGIGQTVRANLERFAF